MAVTKPKPPDEMRMPADEFERIMRDALAAPAPKKAPEQKTKRAPKRKERSTKSQDA